MTTEDMPLEKALKVITEIAERFERVSRCAEVAERIDRKRADALHGQAAKGSDSGRNDSL